MERQSITKTGAMGRWSRFTARKSAKLIKGAKEIYYPGLPHGLTATHADQVNDDLLAFLKSIQAACKAA
ncbi:alpha/beta fold hydrolase [Acidicapsa ligni]|uniref:alpha/beta fold hydrolase n=1 Tax=Acidicapsa ligni TaxID=542300 RepID=UPI0021DFAF15|nr:hypothetical protein [Acidicapsa ligni]